MSKLEELKKLKSNIIVNGLENFPLDNPSVIVSNHNCLMDIFYQPMALNIPIVSLVSPRLIYKKIPKRQEVIEKYLYAMPIEAHGGKVYSDLCLQSAVSLLEDNISVGIFPEGAYVDGKDIVHRGRTGASRILFEAYRSGVNVNLVPLAIDVCSNSDDLDNYDFNDYMITINILPCINYDNDYDMFCYGKDLYKNHALHSVIDKSLGMIASSLNRKYSDDYIELFKKGNVIFSNGETIDNSLSCNLNFVNRYEEELKDRKKILIKQMHNEMIKKW